MDFSLSEEQQMMLETARRVGKEFGLEYWRELDAQKKFPAELLRQRDTAQARIARRRSSAAAALACSTWHW